MNTVVSFEIAKLLKQKKYKEECRGYWGYDSYFKDWSITYPQTEFKQWYKDEILAPTISDVVMWLYEKHGIWIDVVLSRNERRFTFMIQSFSFNANKFLNEYFNSPAEAYEAAIEYVLNNLV